MKTYLLNLGTVNKNKVTIETSKARLTLYYSYETIVAFSLRCNHPTNFAYDIALQCRENDWGVTTGKFLNEIQPDKKLRISGEEFEKRLAEAYAQL